jgi:hypothetical protein
MLLNCLSVEDSFFRSDKIGIHGNSADVKCLLLPDQGIPGNLLLLYEKDVRYFYVVSILLMNCI